MEKFLKTGLPQNFLALDILKHFTIELEKVSIEKKKFELSTQ